MGMMSDTRNRASIDVYGFYQIVAAPIHVCKDPDDCLGTSTNNFFRDMGIGVLPFESSIPGLADTSKKISTAPCSVNSSFI
ncbi:hypothetical protein X975_21472, partial [Stegodyphus mimosarum]